MEDKIKLTPSLKPIHGGDHIAQGGPQRTAEDERYAKVQNDILAMYASSAETAENAFPAGSEEVLPSFTEELTGHLPEVMEEVVALADNSQQADVYILSALAAFSSCMTNCFFKYNGHHYYPSMMVIVTGSAASGKSAAHVARYLVKQVNDDKQLGAEIAVIEYEESLRGGANPDRLPKPKKITHMLPADSSSAAFDRTLIDNDGCGLIECTELDTLTRSFNSDFGDFSVTLRKAYEHETIEFNRVSDYAIKKVEKPRFSAILAGTPEQVTRLIPTASDGAFSRFLFYCLPPDFNYRVNLEEDELGYARRSDEEEFTALGEEFYGFWTAIKDREQIRFRLTKKNRVRLQEMMQIMQDYCRAKKGDGMVGVLHRLGSCTFKITVALSYLRHMADSNMTYDILCDDQDFNNALVIVKTLLRHTLKLYGSVVRAADTKTLNLKGIDGRKDVKNLWDNLPEEFSSAEFKQLSHELGISHRTTERWLQRWVAEESVTRVSQGQYKKIAE